MSTQTANNNASAWDGINHDRKDAFVTGSLAAGGLVTHKSLGQRFADFRKAILRFSNSVADKRAAFKEYMAARKAENLNLKAHLTSLKFF